jgi:DNA-binding GntR family transcriptional regulator
VIQAFLHSRDCLGEILSQRALSGQFGLSRARVAELVRPLNGADEETQLQEAS